MERFRILLVDLTQYGSEVALVAALERRYRLERVKGAAHLFERIELRDPHLLIFEYDFLDVGRLAALTRAKQKYPSLPVLMVTEEHSEALAVWALRTRVWNYFVKPSPVEAVLESVGMLQRLLLSGRRDAPRTPVLPPPTVPEEARFRAPGELEPADLSDAISYIDDHLNRKITQQQVADHCHMSCYGLSRAFRRRFGITFQEYLVKRRIERAQQLLRNRSASITDVCWAVGFKDPSYFTRAFRRFTGLTPSQFKQEWQLRREERTDLETSSS